MKKVILITGTSTGLGLSLAIKLAKQGHQVIATMRNLEKKDALLNAAEQANVQVIVKQLDVQDGESIVRCVNEVMTQEGRIDTLINNAGAGMIRTTEQASEKDIQRMMDINFMGVIRCIKAVLPHMRQARKGHIINVTSVGGLVGQPFSEFYCAAKFAIEGYVESVASYITPHFNVHFTNVEPGGIETEFASNALAHFQETGGMIEDEYQSILEKLITNAMNRKEGVYQTADQVADVIQTCVNNIEPPIRIRTSDWANQFCELKTKNDPTGLIQQQQVIATLLS